ncbi:MAG: hypothetical protein JWN86_18 [Planctomycetota bacterium]|nr:hypothetical protein [Planctomycetota bacterium]
MSERIGSPASINRLEDSRVETVSNPGADVAQRIQSTRRELLDLSARNRLINTPVGSSRGRKIELVDERSEAVFRLLVRERKAMSFLPGTEEADKELPRDPATIPLAQPEDEFNDDKAPDPRHTDLRLQTRLTSERLQGRLLDMYYDAQTYEQEQGVSILYLAMGFLKWYEAPASDKARYAPLLLIPVDLERQSAATRFRLRFREDEVTTNLSLQAKLKGEFGIDLPDVPDMEEISPEAYFDACAATIAHQPRWEVQRNEMVVWFFSYAKFLMYRDLDPSTWPPHSPLESNPTLSSLLGAGFRSEPALCGENDKIDALIPAANMVHITDADSSQAVVIEEVRQGRHLVVQGPPGTGKSQTITNLIAAAVKEGKKVLFVAEKMAALDVVHRRLEHVGLGAICLELHSNKASKKAVLEQLSQTLNLGRPKQKGSEEGIASLKTVIERLNQHADLLNSPIQPADLTPYQIIGKLVRLYGKGIEATDIALAESDTWSGNTFREKCRSIEELQAYLRQIGPPSDHAWRGVTRTEPILHGELRDLLAKVRDSLATLADVHAASALLSGSVGLPAPDAPSLRDVRQLSQLASRLVNAPAMDRGAIANSVWQSRREEITRLVKQGEEYASGVAELRKSVADVAWQTDLSATRIALASHGRSLFRWFRRDYRAAIAMLRGVLQGEFPGTLEERLGIVDRVMSLQALTKVVVGEPANNQLGRDAFGHAWRGLDSDWQSLAAIVNWEGVTREIGLTHDYRQILSRLDRPEACQAAMAAGSESLESATMRLAGIAEVLSFDASDGFWVEDLDAVPTPVLMERLRGWQREPEALSRWIGYQMRRRRLEQEGLGSIISRVHEGQVTIDLPVDLFQVAYYQGLIREVFRRHPALAEFDGLSHESWIEEFRGLDQARIVMARNEVATAHFNAIPHAATGGEMAVVRREIEKKRRHKPIRQLLKEAGTAILGIKPVFMMSPISVAQYLEPGSVTFDLLLIDEASQVGPVDALGAMARARQVVVVGDDKQLPPTRFFTKMMDDGDSNEDSESDINAGDLESILGLCVAQGMSQRMLRWHYRSRHHSLIAVSNREFYDNRLYVIPSPATITAMHGLHFHLIQGGVFDRGGTATNRVEARAIAEAVIEHARNHPKMSLGVGAFSVSQRDAIRDELEILQREHVDLAEFFASGRHDPFFVKNLENIQGDERDVIFISVGYARDSSGYLAMNFGPLSSQGGERRLNVLITRARERCEVFSSITADDIDLERAKSSGAAAFKTFLRYAATGVLDNQAPTGEDFDSDFEKEVAMALERRGFEVHRQVGMSGFIIDLAVIDSTCPGRYVLGIECDGATYHSSRSARDRDRLRETVLRDRGWKIHRVWSTDWFHRPGEQLETIVAAIEKARTDTIADEEAEVSGKGVPAESPIAEAEIERAEPAEEPNGNLGAAWALPYVEAAFEVANDKPIPETNPSILSRIVAKVVDIEGPIHREEIARRITSLWGLQRTGNRIAEVISSTIDSGLSSGVLRSESDFITHAKQAVLLVRNRSNVDSVNLKKPEMISPSEVRRAIHLLVAEHVGVRDDEIPLLVARALGFRATSPRLKDMIEEVLADLIEKHTISRRDDKLFLE